MRRAPGEPGTANGVRQTSPVALFFELNIITLFYKVVTCPMRRWLFILHSVSELLAEDYSSRPSSVSSYPTHSPAAGSCGRLHHFFRPPSFVKSAVRSWPTHLCFYYLLPGTATRLRQIPGINE